MDTKELKFLTGYIVTESDLSKDSKIQLLNFIQKEADDHQLKALLLDGKIISLDEQSKQIVDDRFEIYQLNEVGKIIVLALVYAASKGAMAVYNRFFSKAAKFCSKYNGQEKTMCMSKAKIAAIKEKIKYIQKESIKCDNTKNPKKCKKLMKKKIDKEKIKLQKVLSKI